MFSAILPEDIKIKRVQIADTHISKIHSDEREIASIFTNDKRKAAFIAGREAAKEAQIELHNSYGAVGRNKERQPIWPKGIIGSITHTKTEAYAVVAQKARYQTIGIDLEELKTRQTYDISERISCEAEYEWIHKEEKDTQIRTLMLFTAKEALYKAVYPHYKQVFGFSSAVLSWNEEQEYFDAELNLDGLKASLKHHKIYSAVYKPHVAALTYIKNPTSP